MAVALRRRTLGELVGHALEVFFRQLPLLLTLQLLVWIPYHLLRVWLFEAAAAPHPDPTGPASSVAPAGYGLLSFPLSLVLAGASTQAVAALYTGGQATLGGALSLGLRKLPALLILAVLTGLLIALGFLMLVIPGLLLAVLFSVSIPAAVVENRAPIEAIRRSARLTQGSRWRVFFFLVVLYGAGYLLGLMAGVLEATVGLASDPAPFFGALLQAGTAAVSGAFQASALVSLYFELRVRREGLDVAQLAEFVDLLGRRAPAS